MSVTASDARKHLIPLIEKVNNDRVAVEITSRRGNAVLVSSVEYAALQETAHLLRVPANAKRLLESLQQALSGDRPSTSSPSETRSSRPTVGGTTSIGCRSTVRP